MPRLEPLAVPLGPACLAVLPRLAEAMGGDAPVLPYAASAPLPAVPPHDPAELFVGLAAVVGTSGSTGTPKRALLSARALLLSGRATHERLGGDGQWLLALPAQLLPWGVGSGFLTAFSARVLVGPPRPPAPAAMTASLQPA